MKITWLGHSCFKIEKDGFILIIDPYEDGSVPGLSNLRETANMVLCSHEHSDHNAKECVTLEEKEASLFKVEIIETYHDDVQGAARGKNKIFVIDDGSNRIAHLGDLGCGFTKEQQEKLQGLDALLIPVGGHYTIDGTQAAELVKSIKPRITVPMHYRSDESGFGYAEISTVEEFTDKMDSVMTLEGSKINLEEDYPASVVVISPYNSSK